MSNSVGLGPSIFCRKMEKMRAMREEMDGKCSFAATDRIFTLMLSPIMKILSLFVP